MPRYDYACPDCETRQEVTHGFHESPELTCPECGGTLAKAYGAVGVQFKGPGFYSTDNK